MLKTNLLRSQVHGRKTWFCYILIPLIVLLEYGCGKTISGSRPKLRRQFDSDTVDASEIPNNQPPFWMCIKPRKNNGM